MPMARCEPAKKETIKTVPLQNSAKSRTRRARRSPTTHCHHNETIIMRGLTTVPVGTLTGLQCGHKTLTFSDVLSEPMRSSTGRLNTAETPPHPQQTQHNASHRVSTRSPNIMPNTDARTPWATGTSTRVRKEGTGKPDNSACKFVTRPKPARTSRRRRGYRRRSRAA